MKDEFSKDDLLHIIQGLEAALKEQALEIVSQRAYIIYLEEFKPEDEPESIFDWS